MAGTPLFMAVQSGEVEKLLPLLMAGVDVREPGWNPNWTPLGLAVHLENPDMVKLLLQFKADPTERNSWNATFLHIIAYRNGPRGIWTGPGVDPQIERERRLTDVARQLIKHGVDVSARDDRGLTALLLAAQNCHVEMVSVLLGCPHLDFLDPGTDGWTAEQMVARLLVMRLAIANPALTSSIDATREILAMLRAEPERRAQDRRAAFAMALIPRLGVASPVAVLDPEMVRMVLETLGDISRFVNV
jgi:ankyrin repeat protein